MKSEELREVIACLPTGRTLWAYGKDDYAFRLLHRAAAEFATLEELRRSRFGGLLEKPVVKEEMAKGSSSRWFGPAFGRGRDGTRLYRLTVAEWGDDDPWWRYDQMSRRGKSLVLQLNLTGQHAQALAELVGGRDRDPFNEGFHPTRTGHNATLAWARLDVDLETGEGLIEEIQNDRLRAAFEAMRTPPCEDCGAIHYRGFRLNREALIRYWYRTLEVHADHWEEAMMMAAIEFLREELGLRRIFYHSFDTGCLLKSISGTRPPRSLYTRLPKKFCFRETGETPSFLKVTKKLRYRLKREGKEVRFWVF